MQRPVMDPLFVKPFEAPKKRAGPIVLLFSAVRWVGKTLISRPLALYKPGQQPRVFRPMAEFVRAAACQAVFLPLALCLTAGVLVYIGTHPSTPAIALDPNSQGIYFDQVSLTSDDGTPLMAWFSPVIDARRVLAHKDRALRQKDPAVILVHDFGQSPQQLLPLVGPLHDEGVAVLAIGVRGVGTSKSAGQTFGLNEASDVRAAVDFLRQSIQIDSSKIAVVGLGSGATAALLAAQRDSSIKALVLADPVRDFDEVLERRIGPSQAWVKWMRPLSQWAFQFCYHVNADDVSFDRLKSITESRPTLVLPHGSERSDYFTRKRIAKVQLFIHEQLRAQSPQVAANHE